MSDLYLEEMVKRRNNEGYDTESLVDGAYRSIGGVVDSDF